MAANSGSGRWSAHEMERMIHLAPSPGRPERLGPARAGHGHRRAWMARQQRRHRVDQRLDALARPQQGEHPHHRTAVTERRCGGSPARPRRRDSAVHDARAVAGPDGGRQPALGLAHAQDERGERGEHSLHERGSAGVRRRSRTSPQRHSRAACRAAACAERRGGQAGPLLRPWNCEREQDPAARAARAEPCPPRLARRRRETRHAPCRAQRPRRRRRPAARGRDRPARARARSPQAPRRAV